MPIYRKDPKTGKTYQSGTKRTDIKSEQFDAPASGTMANLSNKEKKNLLEARKAVSPDPRITPAPTGQTPGVQGSVTRGEFVGVDPTRAPAFGEQYAQQPAPFDSSAITGPVRGLSVERQREIEATGTDTQKEMLAFWREQEQAEKGEGALETLGRGLAQAGGVTTAQYQGADAVQKAAAVVSGILTALTGGGAFMYVTVPGLPPGKGGGLPKGQERIYGIEGGRGYGALKEAAKEGARGFSTHVPNMVNTVTERYTTQFIIKQGIKRAIVPTVVSIIGFSAFSVGWGMETMGTAMLQLDLAIRDANDAEEFELARELEADRKELFNPELWDKLKWIPGVGVGFAGTIATAANLRASEAQAYLTDKMINAAENGESEDEMWNGPDGIHAQQKAREEQTRLDDLAHAEVIKQFWVTAAEEGRTADELYWKKQRELADARKIKQREEDALYWEEVRKHWEKIKEEEGRSRLNFGLLR